jgi:hypothetical protein
MGVRMAREGCMEPDHEPSGGRFSLRGKTGLIAAVAVVAVLLIGLPAYRVFFGISVLIAVVVAAVLHFWHKYRPLKETDVEHKKPLGLE